MGGTSETGNARVSGSILVNDCDTSTVWVHLVNERFIPGDDTNEMVYKVAVNPQGEYHFDKVKLNNYYLYIKAHEQNSLRGPLSISVPDMELGKDTLHYTSQVSVYIPDFSENDFIFIKGIPEKYVVSSGFAMLSEVPSGQINIIRVSGNYSKPFNDTASFKDKIVINIKQMDALSISFNNAAPEFDELKILSQTVELDCQRYYDDTLYAIDPDSDRITYRLSGCPENMQIKSASGAFTWKVPDSFNNKTVTFNAIAEDSGGASRMISWKVTFTSNCVLSYPSITVSADSIHTGDTVNLNMNKCLCRDSSISGIVIDWGNSQIDTFISSDVIYHYFYFTQGIYFIRGKLICTTGNPSYPDWFNIDSVIVFPKVLLSSIHLEGSDTMFVLQGVKPFKDPGAKVVNEYTGDTIEYTFSRDSVDYQTSGKYIISYNYDSSKTATRTVYVVSYNSTLPTFALRTLDTTDITDSSFAFSADSVRIAANSPLVRFSCNAESNNYSDTSDWSRTLTKVYLLYLPGTYFVSAQYLDLSTLQYSKWSLYTHITLSPKKYDTDVEIQTSFDTLHPYERLDLFKIGSNCAGNGSELIKVFWGDQFMDSSFSNKMFHHTYTSPGQYSIEVQVSCDSSPIVDTIILNQMSVIMGSTIDSVAPFIQLTGNDTVILPIGAISYTDPGATATDDRDGDLTASIIKKSFIDFSKSGEYYYLYIVKDSVGNQASAFRKVIIQ
jgi:hypothetical protein